MEIIDTILSKLEESERNYIRSLLDLDELTQIFNRRFFNKKLEEEVQKANYSKKGLSLLMFDVDNFKTYQDNHRDGHLAGDRLLKDIIGVMTPVLRGYDTICRYGGEELAIICPDTTLNEGMKIAERLRVNIFKNLPVTISAGIAHYKEDSDSLLELIRNADRNLYLAKASGKNKVLCSRNT